MRSRTIVIGIGELFWDIYPKGKALGGAPINFTFHCSQFGADGIPVSSIGDDALGDEILTFMQDRYCNTNYINRHESLPTGTILSKVSEDGELRYQITAPVAWDTIEFTAVYERLAQKVTACCFGTLAQRSPVSRTNIMRFLDAMPDDSLKIFDLNIQQDFYTTRIIENSLNVSNILKLNGHELHLLANLFELTGSPVEQLKQLRKRYNLDIIIFLRKDNGSILVSQHEVCEHAGVASDTINNAGAADSFVAAFCMDYLKGNSLEQINNHANQVSAFVGSQNNPMPILPEILIN